MEFEHKLIVDITLFNSYEQSLHMYMRTQTSRFQDYNWSWSDCLSVVSFIRQSSSLSFPSFVHYENSLKSGNIFAMIHLWLTLNSQITSDLEPLVNQVSYWSLNGQSVPSIREQANYPLKEWMSSRVGLLLWKSDHDVHSSHQVFSLLCLLTRIFSFFLFDQNLVLWFCDIHQQNSYAMI